jgi:UDP-glucose 4,6-dehydratase
MDELVQAADYKTALVLRLRLPVGDDLNPRSLITKLLGYKNLVDIPNSVSVLHNLLPVAIQMARDGRRGTYNFTNHGTLSHNEIMTIYKDIVDPSYTWNNFSEEEQNKIVKAKRSNNYLDTSKLKEQYPQVKNAKEAMIEAMQEVKKSLENGGPKAPPKPE